VVRVYALRGFLHSTPHSVEELVGVLREGVDGLVVDVYASKDGVPVVTFDRVIGGVDVASVSYEEVRRVLRVPDAATLISSTAADLVLWVRDNSLLDTLPRLVERAGAVGRVYVAVDDLLQARAVRGVSASVKLVLRISNPYPNITVIRREGVDAVALPPALVRPRLIRECTSRGVKVVAWPVNDVAQAARVVRYGVEVLVTSRPTLKRELAEYLQP